MTNSYRDKHKLLEKAILIATKAHFGQTDKSGMPYIFHPLRVMQNCSCLDEKIVAVLHDTLEDTEVTSDYLVSEKFPPYLIEAVVALTKKPDEAYNEFIDRVALNGLAAVVKIEDIKDNMDVSRLRVILPRDVERLNKYAEALHKLTSSKG